MPRPMKKQEKAKDFKGTINKLFKMYLFKYKFQLLLITIFAIGGTVFNIVGPKILGNATTEIFNGLVSKFSGGAGINFENIANILITLITLYVIGMILSFAEGVIMTYVAQKISYKMRNDLSEKLNRLPMKYFDKRTHGEILSTITNDIDTLSMNMNQNLTEIIRSTCTLIGIVIMMFSINVTMTFVTILMLPVTVICISIIAKKSQKFFNMQQEYLAKVNGHVEEIYGGHNIVKAFNREKDTIKEFDAKNEDLYRTAWKSQFLSGLMRPIMMFVGNISYVVISILGGYYAFKGIITVGNIQSFIQYSRQFTQPIAQLAEISASIQSMVAAAERVINFLNEKEEVQQPKNAKKLPEEVKGNVKFDHVVFGYDDNKTIINDFSADIKAGQKVAIVGPTGAGKTTIVKLLMRFYDLKSGAIYVDGVDISKCSRCTVREKFGMVLQDTWLYSGTIKDNIKYGKPEACDSEIIEVAKTARVHHFIKTLPNGYDMVLNEESSNISSGQKQLLTMARVLLMNPKILILDEATSSIDTRTEIEIQKAMDNMMEGRTSFVIAHRLSTIKNADLILVMQHGDIVEQGKHEELLAKNGEYAKLYNSQFEEEEE